MEPVRPAAHEQGAWGPCREQQLSGRHAEHARGAPARAKNRAGSQSQAHAIRPLHLLWQPLAEERHKSLLRAISLPQNASRAPREQASCKSSAVRATEQGRDERDPSCSGKSLAEGKAGIKHCSLKCLGSGWVKPGPTLTGKLSQ